MPSRRNRYLGTLLLLIASVCAGAAGASLIIYSAVGTVEVSSVRSVPERVLPAPDPGRVASAARAAVSFYRARDAGTPLEAAFLPSDLVGNGISVTADGWLISTIAVFSDTNRLIAVYADGATAQVDPRSVVRDDATGLAFARAPIERRTVAGFGDDTLLAPGEFVYLPAVPGMRTIPVSRVRALPGSGRADLVESTERLARRLILASPGIPGTPVVNSAGEIVAVVESDGAAVPAPFVAPIMRGVFVDGRVVRPSAGINYLSLDLLTADPPRGVRGNGALVLGSSRARGVLRGSAAEAAGIREGDVITHVERDTVDADTTLAELMQDYEPGATVNLTFFRSGNEQKTSLTIR